MKNSGKKPGASMEPVVPKTLDDFIHFMDPNKYGSGWVLVNKSHDLVTYEKTYKAESGNWFIAIILLLVFVVPGIIYMVYARHPARTVRLTVAKKADGTLVPSGDREGIAKYNKFIGRRQFMMPSKPLAWVGGIIIFLILYSIGHASLKQARVNANLSSANTSATNSSAVKPDLSQKVTVELLKKDFVQGTYQDQITLQFKLTNTTEKDIQGVDGVTTFYDIFDKEITAQNLSYDKGIPKNSSRIYDAAIDYNQFMDEHVKLKDTDIKNLKMKWQANTIIYQDGTKEAS